MHLKVLVILPNGGYGRSAEMVEGNLIPFQAHPYNPPGFWDSWEIQYEALPSNVEENPHVMILEGKAYWRKHFANASDSTWWKDIVHQTFSGVTLASLVAVMVDCNS